MSALTLARAGRRLAAAGAHAAVDALVLGEPAKRRGWQTCGSDDAGPRAPAAHFGG